MNVELVGIAGIDAQGGSVMKAASLQHQVSQRFISAGITRGGKRMSIEIEYVLVDSRPGTVVDLDAISCRVAVPRGARMLVVMDVVAEDPYLPRPADAIAGVVVRRLLSGALLGLI